jgi:hypothetical protein
MEFVIVCKKYFLPERGATSTIPGNSLDDRASSAAEIAASMSVSDIKRYAVPGLPGAVRISVSDKCVACMANACLVSHFPPGVWSGNWYLYGGMVFVRFELAPVQADAIQLGVNGE